MTELVKLLTDEDGEVYENPEWHVVDHYSSDPCALCSGEFFGEGQGNVTYKLKHVKRGGITCRKCLNIIRWIKSEIKL